MRTHDELFKEAPRIGTCRKRHHSLRAQRGDALAALELLE
jgi:hypothetical protein